MAKFVMDCYISKHPKGESLKSSTEAEFIDVENTDCDPQVIMNIEGFEVYLPKKGLAEMVRALCNKQL